MVPIRQFFSHRLIWLALLVALGIGTLFARTIWTMRNDEWSYGEKTNANLVSTLGQGWAWSLDSYDKSLDGGVREVSRPEVWALPPELRSRVVFDSSLRARGAGDVLVLGKPLGVGILSAALKKGRLNADQYADMLQLTTQLNRVGTALAELPAVHAMTDVTGFGLAGHLLAICKGSRLAAEVPLAPLPLISSAVGFAQEGMATGASARNWLGYGNQVRWPSGAAAWQHALVSDPQTSGGLLVSCAADSVAAVLHTFHAAGFVHAAAIGHLQAAGPAGVGVDFVGL